MKTAVLTISDKGAAGKREDASGPAIEDFITEHGGEIVYYDIVPDEFEEIEKCLNKLCNKDEVELILTSGGTGFAERDITPEVTEEVIVKEAPGIGEKMRSDTSRHTELSYLSRAKAGIKNKTLIINLPGSPKAVKQCLESIIEILPHGIDILQGEITEH